MLVESYFTDNVLDGNIMLVTVGNVAVVEVNHHDASVDRL